MSHSPVAGYGLSVMIRSTFALLFVVIVAVPFRRGQRWAWWAAWIVMIADLGYTFTFGRHGLGTASDTTNQRSAGTCGPSADSAARSAAPERGHGSHVHLDHLVNGSGGGP